MLLHLLKDFSYPLVFSYSAHVPLVARVPQFEKHCFRR